MSLINECQFRASAGGLADFVVASAVAGYFTPAQCTNPTVVDGALYYWRAESDDFTQHEFFQGTYTAAGTVVARTTILQSSNGGSKVNFTAAPRLRQVVPTQILNNYASLVDKHQVSSAGATIVPADLGTISSGSLTIDFGLGPLQTVICNGAFNLNAPTADGSTILKVTNGASAGLITPVGYTQGAHAGDPVDTINGNKFAFSIFRIAGDSRFSVLAYQ